MASPVPAIESITTASLSLGLDAAALRHSVHVSNIANASVAGNRRMTVDDARQLSAAQAALARQGSAAGSSLAAVRFSVQPAPADADGSTAVKLDREMADLNANNVRYQLLINALNQHLGLLDLAVNDGKR